MLLHCNACGFDKDPQEFNNTNRKHIEHGEWAWCKACAKAYNIQYRKDHAEEIRAKKKQKYDALTDEERTEVFRKSNERIKANPEERRTTTARYYANNREICIERNLKWQDANPDKVREIAVQSEARKRALAKGDPQNDVSVAQVRKIFAAYDFRCVYCPPSCRQCQRKTHRLTVDHLTPLSKGGSNTASNIVPACKSHNSQKNVGPVLNPVQPLLLTIAPAKPTKKGKD